MSEMINALERKGLVERYENAANRRVLHIHLSEAGRVLLEQADVRVDGLETELFSGLNNGEVAVLRGLVSRALGVGRDVPNG
jgi:DNA-binding MarR family transcriptional regulator